MRRLTPLALTRAAFAPFGEVVTTEGAQRLCINQGSCERFHALATADCAAQDGQTILSLFRAQPRVLPLEIRVMERHPLGSQAFIPLTQNPDDVYLIVVAPPGPLQAGQLQAFVGRGLQGVNYGRGVWHHPLIALRRVSDFLVMDRSGPGDNCEEIAVAPGIWLDF